MGGAARKRISAAVRRQLFHNFGFPVPQNKDVSRTEALLNLFFKASDGDIRSLALLPIGKSREWSATNAGQDW